MPNRLLATVAVSVALALGVTTFLLLGSDADHGARLDRARGLLHASFAAAPELHDLDAQGALAALEGIEAPERIGLVGLARAIDGLVRGEAVFARRGLEDATRWLPRSPMLAVLAAEIAALEGDSVAARSALADAAARYPDAPRVRLALADGDLDRGDGDAALEWLEPLAKAFPGLAAVQNRRGLALELEGARAAARAAFLHAARLDDGRPEARINLGRLHLGDGDPEGAARWFGEALVIDPTHASALFGRGLARLALRDDAGAERDLVEAAALAPEDADVRLALGDVARRRGDEDEALQSYREAVVLDPRNEAAWVRLGNALVRARALDEARRAYENALGVVPELPAAARGLEVLARLR